MREMKDSGIEWIGAMPQDWKLNRIQFCLSEINEKNNPIRTTQVLSLVKDKGVMLYEEKGDVGNKSKNDCSEYKLAFPNTLVVNSMNILIGSVGISSHFGCVSPVYYVFKETDYADLRFINYIFNTREFQKELRKYANGILEIRLRVSADDIFKRKIPFPLKDEQKRIADFLDGKCAEIDALVADIQSQIDTLEQYKRSVITETVTKGLNPDVEMKDSRIKWVGMIPNKWNASKIKYIAEFAPRCGIERLKPDSVVGYAPMECIKKGFFMERTAIYSTIPNSLTPFENGDIVMAKVTPCFENGNIAIMENLKSGIGFGSSELFVLRPKMINTKYLFYWLQNDGFINKAASTMTGMGGLKRVSPKFVQDSFICIPTITEQKCIADFLDTKCTEIDNIINQKKEQLGVLDSYKKSLIYEYVTGKKEVPAQ